MTETSRIYRPLDQTKKEIRLLKIEPGLQNDDIFCTFAYAELSQKLVSYYETISYTWGDASLRGTIKVHGYVVDVPHSAEVVLRQFRLLRGERCLWIDAVCINQEDLDERSHQVSLMSDIYSKTVLNLIWLGENDADTMKKAHESMNTVIREMMRDTNDYCDLTKHLYATMGQLLYSKTAITSTGIDWEAIRNYYSSPWFGRLWIVQEAALAAKSICYSGKSMQPLERVLKVAIWILHKINAMPAGFVFPQGLKCAAAIFMYADHEYGRHEILYNRGQCATTLDLLLGSLSDFDARDTRDHIFGIVGLYQKYMRCESLPLPLLPNYRASTRQVFRDVTRYLLQQSGDLGFLYNIKPSPDNICDDSWLSWVPRWSKKYDGYSEQREVRSRLTRADGDRNFDVTKSSLESDADALVVQGVQLGIVSHVTLEFTPKRFHDQGAEAMQELLEQSRSIHARLKSEDSFRGSDRLAHTLIRGFDGHTDIVTETRSAELFAAFRYYIFELGRFPCGLSDVIEGASATGSNAANFSQALANATFNRSIFSVASDFLGNGPSVTRPGDIAAIFFGFASPVILRPVVSRPLEYRFVGYCYIHGVMEGEAVRAHEAAGKEASTFHLR